MSANRDEITTRNPKSMSAHTACSRDEPVPKSGPATRTEPLSKGGWFRTNDGSLRHAANRPSSKPGSGDPFQVDRRDDLVGVDIGAAQGHADPGVGAEGFHALSPAVRSAAQVGGRGQGAADGGRRGDRRRHQVGAAAFALAAFEVAVGRRRATLARRELIGVHAEAHRAAGLPPFGTRGGEDLAQAFGFGLARTRMEPGTTSIRTPSAHFRSRRTSATTRRSSMRPLVQEPTKTVSIAMSRIAVPG